MAGANFSLARAGNMASGEHVRPRPLRTATQRQPFHPGGGPAAKPESTSWQHNDRVASFTLVALGAIVSLRSSGAGVTLGTVGACRARCSGVTLDAIVACRASGAGDTAFASLACGPGRSGFTGGSLGASCACGTGSPRGTGRTGNNLHHRRRRLALAGRQGDCGRKGEQDQGMFHVESFCQEVRLLQVERLGDAGHAFRVAGEGGWPASVLPLA